jgi:hypothetical protein
MAVIIVGLDLIAWSTSIHFVSEDELSLHHQNNILHITLNRIGPLLSSLSVRED